MTEVPHIQEVQAILQAGVQAAMAEVDTAGDQAGVQADTAGEVHQEAVAAQAQEDNRLNKTES